MVIILLDFCKGKISSYEKSVMRSGGGVAFTTKQNRLGTPKENCPFFQGPKIVFSSRFCVIICTRECVEQDRS
jgi:hypothetical protein